MASVELRNCPVERTFDPLSPEFLADPFAVMHSLTLVERPVFYAPSIDYYVLTRYRDIEGVFSDPDSYSAAAAQLPLVELDPEARQILLDGGVRPQPSMVSLDPPDHTRLRRRTARAFSARRTAEMEPRIRAIPSRRRSPPRCHKSPDDRRGPPRRARYSPRAHPRPLALPASCASSNDSKSLGRGRLPTCVEMM
jgi:cytochrome P450